jgi:hypothetical protein
MRVGKFGIAWRDSSVAGSAYAGWGPLGYNHSCACSHQCDCCGDCTLIPMSAVRAPRLLATVSHLCSIVLAAALLTMIATGHAGVQVLDQATAARLSLLHLHGVPGESDYVRTFGAPAPFVHPHCHRPAASAADQPGPFEIVSAGSLAGAALCAPVIAAPVAPVLSRLGEAATVSLPRDATLSPPTEPPR